jgi:hypothetical protein
VRAWPDLHPAVMRDPMAIVVHRRVSFQREGRHASGVCCGSGRRGPVPFDVYVGGAGYWQLETGSAMFQLNSLSPSLVFILLSSSPLQSTRSNGARRWREVVGVLAEEKMSSPPSLSLPYLSPPLSVRRTTMAAPLDFSQSGIGRGGGRTSLVCLDRSTSTERKRTLRPNWYSPLSASQPD